MMRVQMHVVAHYIVVRLPPGKKMALNAARTKVQKKIVLAVEEVTAGSLDKTQNCKKLSGHWVTGS